MDWIIFQLIQHYIPAEYMAPLILILGFIVAFEQWLARTNRIKANSTLDMIIGILSGIICQQKEKENAGGSRCKGTRSNSQSVGSENPGPAEEPVNTSN